MRTMVRNSSVAPAPPPVEGGPRGRPHRPRHRPACVGASARRTSAALVRLLRHLRGPAGGRPDRVLPDRPSADRKRLQRRGDDARDDDRAGGRRGADHPLRPPFPPDPLPAGADRSAHARPGGHRRPRRARGALPPGGSGCRARWTGQRRRIREPARRAEPPGAVSAPAAGARRGRHPQRGHLRDLPGARRGAGQHLAAGRRVGDGAAGDGPVLLLPRIATATAPGPEQRRSRLRLTPIILLWLVCGGASAASISAIEIGAVSLAVGFGMPAAWGVLFPVALCVTSILGGIWVSIHNRMPRRRTVLAWLAVTALGVAAVGFGHSVAATVIGAL